MPSRSEAKQCAQKRKEGQFVDHGVGGHLYVALQDTYEVVGLGTFIRLVWCEPHSRHPRFLFSCRRYVIDRLTGPLRPMRLFVQLQRNTGHTHGSIIGMPDEGKADRVCTSLHSSLITVSCQHARHGWP